VNFTVLLDSDGATGYSYNVSGVPSTFIIDGAGIVRMIEPKFNNLQEFESMISQISPSAFH
jgi:peroxiredoxin